MSRQTNSKSLKLKKSDDFLKAVHDLFVFFSAESRRGSLLLGIHKVIPRVSAALKIPQSTVRDIIHRKENAAVFDVVNSLHKGNSSSTCKPNGRPRKFDDFDECAIRQTIHDMYRCRQFVSLRLLWSKLKSKGMDISVSGLYSLLKRSGFKYFKNGVGKKFVGERADVIAHRHSYLREIRKVRNEGFDIVYTDETWLNANHACKGEWNDGKMGDFHNLVPGCSECGRCIPSGKGKRLIIVDAGSDQEGFISGANLVFLSKTKSGDYHDEMNGDHYLDWFENHLLRSLQQPSVIVMDNAPYHNMLTTDTKCPTIHDRKDVIQTWLDAHDIKYDYSFIKAELIELVKMNKPRAMYETDRLAFWYGHMVMRLPVKHCELNPIELIQAELKSGVARRNNTFKIKDVKKLFVEVRETIGVESWKKAVKHVIGVEDHFWKTDGVREESVERVAFDILDSDATDSISDDISDTTSLPEMICEEVNATEDEDSESVCVVCNSDFPPQLPLHTKQVVHWAQCDYCDGWVHLKFCSPISIVLANIAFSCPKCTCKLKNIEPEP